MSTSADAGPGTASDSAEAGATKATPSPAPGPDTRLMRGLSVTEVLGTAVLKGSRVLAGAAGLDRPVQRLNVMEGPDSLEWVKPHELLLTTGYPLRASEDLAKLAGDLDDRGVSALAVKFGRYLGELPAEMLREADRRGFPVIGLHDDVAFDDIL